MAFTRQQPPRQDRGRHRTRSVDGRPTPRSARRPSLLRRFGLLSLVVVILIGAVLALLLETTIRRRAIEDAARSGEVAVNIGVRPFLLPEDLGHNFVPLAAERLDDLDATLGSSLSPNGIVRLKVWNRQHWLVYSDNPRLRGRWFAGADTLERSFAGELTTEVTDLTAPEEREERSFGELLAVYVPLRVGADGEFTSDVDGEIVGAFEIYLPYAPIATAIRDDTRRLWLGLAIGLGALYLAVFRLVAGASRRLRIQAEENLILASRDTLTGLLNRDAFIRGLEERVGGGVLLLLDLDDFQTVNDTLGHRRGDELLAVVGTRLRANVREHDLLGRVGGDEFAVFFAGPLSELQHTQLVTRLIEALHRPEEIDGLELDVRASIGGVSDPEREMSPEQLIQRADIAVAAAKSNQSTLEYYQNDLENYSPETLRLVSEVRAGLAGGQFHVVYQPKLDLRTSAIESAEVLLRWSHPERGAVSPGSFMPVVERLPIGREVTDFVLKEAVKTLAEQMSDDVTSATGLAVNLSARDVNDPRIVGVIGGLLEQYGVSAGRLTIELTEGSVLTNETRAANTLDALRSLGCGVAVDDFGTGYASLSYLMRLPATEMKIDQSFVLPIASSDRSRDLVRHCIDIGKTLGIRVTAEGIENQATLDLLDEMGCDTAQGYFISRPIPLDEFIPFIRARAAENTPDGALP